MPDYAEAAIMTSLNIDSRYRIQSARDYMHALHGDSFQPTEWTVETTLFEQDELEQKHKFFSKKRILLLIAICLAIVASGMVAAIKLRKNTDVVVTNNKELPDLKGMTEEAPESPLVQALSKVYREQTGQEAELLSIGGGTYAKACPNLVAFGPLFPGQEMTEHQPDEYMEADTLLKNAQMMAAAIWELAR